MIATAVETSAWDFSRRVVGVYTSDCDLETLLGKEKTQQMSDILNLLIGTVNYLELFKSIK